MALTQDFSSMFKDMMGNFPIEMGTLEDSWKTSAGFGEKMSALALDAAGESAELSTQWTVETLGRLADLTKAKSDPTEYAQAVTDFTSAQMESATGHMTAFGEIAKKYQTGTLDLMMSAGKDLADDASAAAATTAKAAEKAATTPPAATPAKRTTTAAAKKTPATET